MPTVDDFRQKYAPAFALIEKGGVRLDHLHDIPDLHLSYCSAASTLIMARRTSARSPHLHVAGLAEGHTCGLEPVRYDLLRPDGAVAVLALCAIHQVVAMVEEDEILQAKDAYPRDRLLFRSERV